MTATADQIRTGSAGVGRSAAAEWVTALAVTGIVALLHVRYFQSAGPLWRDEISSVEIAASPTIRELLANRTNDSVPLLWHAVLRGWQRLGDTDRDLRMLGLLVGLGVVAVLWRNARSFGARSPIASLVMLGLGAMTVCYGDSLRAYGAGMLMGLWSFGAVFRVTQAAGDRRVRRAIVIAGVASLLSVHTLFYNSIWLLATCVAGAMVCGWNGHRRRAAAVLGIGAACGASMAVYVPLFHARAAFGRMFVVPTSLARVWVVLREALVPTPLGPPIHADLLWAAALVLGVGTACTTLRRRSTGLTVDGHRRRDAARFGLVTLLVGVPAYLGFLRALSNPMQPFYFLALIALAAGCLDGLLAPVARPGRRLAVVVAAAAAAIASVPDAWRSAGMRMSNVDLAAAQMGRLVAPGDVVVVVPWFLGSPFVRYYHGPGDVVTVPPVAALRYQRFDAIYPLLDDPRAVDPVLDRLAAVARAGRHAWVVRSAGLALFADPSAPGTDSGGHTPEYAHDVAWQLQVGSALGRHFDLTRARVLDVGDLGNVSPLERVEVFELQP